MFHGIRGDADDGRRGVQEASVEGPALLRERGIIDGDREAGEGIRNCPDGRQEPARCLGAHGG